MQKFFYIITISVFFSSFGQTLIPNYEIGSFIDYNKKVINGYYDFDYEPKAKLNVTYQAGENFAKGFYLDSEGKKVIGLLKYSHNDRELKFKLYEKDFEKSIEAIDTKGYVIGIDTSSVVDNVLIMGNFGDKLSKNAEFAERIETIDRVTFYKFSSIAPNGTFYSKYIIFKNSFFETFPTRKSKFIDMATDVFGSDPVLKSYIQNGKYTVDDLPSLIKIFKYRKLHDKGQNIFYNANKDEINNEAESVYYSQIESVHDSVFHISNYLKNKVKIFDGDFTSFYPHKKQGVFTFYFPNGAVRRKLEFKNNKPVKETLFYENEKTQSVVDILEDGTNLYKSVYDESGKNVLDTFGNGIVAVFDLINNRIINYEFKANKLVSSYYEDSELNKVYQLCPKNAEIKGVKSLQKSIKEYIIYPEESVRRDNHGILLVKCIVEPSGLVPDISIVKGIDSYCDNAVIDYLDLFAEEVHWKPAKVGDNLVKQEIIVPIDFSINKNSTYRNNYYNNWYLNNNMFMLQHQQQQMMMQIQQSINSIPRFR